MNSYQHVPRHLLAIDCIIFGFDGEDLKGLFVKRNLEPQKGNWSLMGGFIAETESVDAAAERVLFELTGLTDVYMEQLHCYGPVSASRKRMSRFHRPEGPRRQTPRTSE